MEDEKQLSGEESLKLIAKTIYEAQGYFYESGTRALVYGFSILACALLTYLREKSLIDFPFNPFYIIIPIFFIQGWLQVKEEKKKKAKTFTDQAIDYVWTGFNISALAAWCANFVGLEYISIMIILYLAAFATFLTGVIAKFTYDIICGFICWALAIFSVFTLNPFIYLLLGVVAVIVFVIPGFILRATFKKQQHATG
jgi:hypothetical protein